MKKHFLLLLCFVVLFFCFNIVFAKKVEINEAKQVAFNFYLEHSPNNIIPKSLYITEDYTISKESIEMYYVFNFNLNGFVIVAADNSVHPILGYSFKNGYTDKNISPEFAFWMNNYTDQIYYVINNNLLSSSEIDAEWSHLDTFAESFISEKEINTVAPLLQSTWDQGHCYNILCPVDQVGSGGHVWAGCVATAMGQVMYYYRYPQQGQGSHSYYSSYGYLSADFASTTYDWNAMSNYCMNNNLEIPKLLYHLGISVDMNYSPDGSGAYMDDAANSLVDYFKYSSSIETGYKNNFSESQWATLLKNELDNNRPILYAGYQPNYASGHAFVCDGYQGTDFFHFNWGWSGYYDGYYFLNNLNPGYNFTIGQMAIYNVYPASNYPDFCTGSMNLTSEAGTIEDGSGPNNYQNNSDCSWLIAPVGAEHVDLSFIYINTEATNDVIVVYDGSNASSPILGTFSGNILPSSISSTGPTMYIRFISNGSINSSGWMVSYSTTYPIFCSGLTTLTAPSGTFSDGSGIDNYSNGSSCRWSLKPNNASSVTLHFTEFNTEAVYDKIRIIDPISSITLATYSGGSIPEDVTSNSGEIYMIFSTNSNNTAEGWTANYTSTPLDVNNIDLNNDITVFPNPAHDNLNISFNLKDKQDVEIIFYDITGKVVFASLITIFGAFDKNIDTSFLSFC